LTGRSRVLELEVLHRSIARSPDDGTVSYSDRRVSAMKLEAGFGVILVEVDWIQSGSSWNPNP
jgi:hypothetical protein